MSLIWPSDSIAKGTLHITGGLWGPSNLTFVEVGDTWISSSPRLQTILNADARQHKIKWWIDFFLRPTWWIAGKTEKRNCGDPRAGAGSTAELPGEFLHFKSCCLFTPCCCEWATVLPLSVLCRCVQLICNKGSFRLSTGGFYYLHNNWSHIMVFLASGQIWLHYHFMLWWL